MNFVGKWFKGKLGYSGKEKGERETVKAWNEEQVEEVAASVQMRVGVKQKGKRLLSFFQVFTNKTKWIFLNNTNNV